MSKLVADNPNIEITEIPIHSQEWYDYRRSGIGSSENGSLLGLTDYPHSSIMDVFQRKIGKDPGVYETGEKAFHGTHGEPWIYECWQHWDGEELGYINNFESGNKIRTADYHGVKDKYYRNKKYPWLFTSSDGLINPGQVDMITGEVREHYGCLEIKRPASRYLYTFDNGIPPYYYFQVHQEMLIFETDYAEIAMLIDGYKFELIPVEFNQRMADIVLESTERFWKDRVVPATKLINKITQLESKGEHVEAQELIAELHRLEPDADSTESYKHFLSHSAQQKEEEVAMQGDMDMWGKATKYKVIGEVVKKLTEYKRLLENQMRKFMLDNDVNKIHFDDDGYFRAFYKKGSEGKTTFDNRIKANLVPKEIERIVQVITKEIDGYGQA